jgi:hypothetical protein
MVCWLEAFSLVGFTCHVARDKYSGGYSGGYPNVDSGFTPKTYKLLERH